MICLNPIQQKLKLNLIIKTETSSEYSNHYLESQRWFLYTGLTVIAIRALTLKIDSDNSLFWVIVLKQ